MKIQTNSSEDTLALGRKMGKNLLNSKPKTRIFFLYGELGAGKTCLTKGIASSLGIKDNIKSPTFTILSKYEISDSKCTFNNLYHWDFYRINTEVELLDLGIEELLADENLLHIVEWPEILQENISTEDYKNEICKIYFKIENDTRIISIK